jgi:hypothetical protein
MCDGEPVDRPNQFRKRAARRPWTGGLGVLAQLLVLALWSASAGAQIPTLVFEADGQRSELKGSDAQCVHDGSGLHCSDVAAGRSLGRWPNRQGSANCEDRRPLAFEKYCGSRADLHSYSHLTDGPHPPNDAHGGSVGAATTDANYNGSGGLSTVAGISLYQALIDRRRRRDPRSGPDGRTGTHVSRHLQFSGSERRTYLPSLSACRGPVRSGPE